VQAQKPPGVRPAAGMPAPVTGPMAEPDPSTHPPGRPHPSDLAASHAPRHVAASVPTAEARRSGSLGGPAPSGPLPGMAPRPAAGAPMATMQSPAHPPITRQPPGSAGGYEEHPADGDGPTIQAPPPMVDSFMQAGLGLGLRAPMHSDAGTLAEATPRANGGPSTMASPQTRAPMIAASPSGGVATLQPDDFDEEDQDPTMVANMRAESGPLQAPPTFPAVAPAAGRSNAPAAAQSFGAPARPPPARFNETAGLAQQNPSSLGYPLQQPGLSPPLQMQPHGQLHGSGDVSFNDTLGMPQGQLSPPPRDPNNHGHAMSNQPPHDYVPRSGPHPTGPTGDLIPRVSARQLPTLNRMGAPNYANRTMTAQRFKRRPPMWVVAALSCSIALLIAGVVIAIISSTSSPSTPKGSAPASSAGGVAPVSGTGAGPFSSARIAFNAVVNAPGSTLASPPGAPAPTQAATTAAVAAPSPDPPPAGVAAAPQPAGPQPVGPTAPSLAAAPMRPAPAAPAPALAPAPPKAAAGKSSALGAITVVCMPKCDQIIDNGTSLGPGHIFNRPVPSGRHVLQLSAPNGARKNLVVEIAPEQTKEVRMSMDK